MERFPVQVNDVDPSIQEDRVLATMVPAIQRIAAIQARIPTTPAPHFTNDEWFGTWISHILNADSRDAEHKAYDASKSTRLPCRPSVIDFDVPLPSRPLDHTSLLQRCGVDLHECFDRPESLDTLRKVFERRIRYWHCRPMAEDEATIVAPADARIVSGYVDGNATFVANGVAVSPSELLGPAHPRWQSAFDRCSIAIFALAPDKYHYNHFPVSGTVVDFYEIASPHSASAPRVGESSCTANRVTRRATTIIDTDIEGGTSIGLVAMVELVGLSSGDVIQCYSEALYDDPLPVCRGMFVERGAPKSLFRPGSGTDVLLFETERVQFSTEIAARVHHTSTQTATDVRVRSPIARRRDARSTPHTVNRNCTR